MSLLFDLLPVELIFQIFAYLTTLDLIHAFSDLSSYIIQCLISYDKFNVNFQSIRKADFERICSFIQPHQVISLILSDDDGTPGQIDLFLSRISIGQFVRLRVLRLIRANHFAAWRSLPAHLSKLPQLHSIHIDFDKIRPDIYDESHSNLDYIFRSPTVTSLFLINGRQSDIDFASLSVAPHLCQFRVQLWRLADLPIVLSRVPNIRTLQIEMQDKIMHNSKCLSLKTASCQFLTRLLVKFKFGISMQQIEQFLESFKHQLTFLRVEIENWQTGHQSFDADWWQTLIICSFPELKTFQLRIRLDTSERRNIEGILEKFRQPFWLYEKGWQFTSDVTCLHSTSLKQPTQILSITIPLDSTPACRFENINTLELYNSYNHNQRIGLAEFVEIQRNFICDFSQLVHLHCGTTPLRSEFLTELLRVAPRLISLSTFDYERLDDMPPTENNAVQYTQIRCLKIERDLTSPDIERICQRFPNVVHVDIQLEKSEGSNVNKLVCRLKDLSSLVFAISNRWFVDKNDRWINFGRIPLSYQLGSVSDWLRSNIESKNYTYELDYQKVRLWIG